MGSIANLQELDDQTLIFLHIPQTGGTTARRILFFQYFFHYLRKNCQSVGGKVPILIDGGFRRGSDVLKALALGARAVLLGRPPLWGLAAYGAKGVQTSLELLQTELASDMAMCGKVNIKAIDRNVMKIHRR